MQPYPPFCGDDGRPCTYADARVAILPVPYEGTVSYGQGAARGPLAILEASAQLEMYDEELDRSIDALGLTTLPPVDCAADRPETVMERIHAAALPALRDGKFLVTLGGEHSISYGVFTALQAVRERPFTLLQIDAHADLRRSYQGTPHSHACIMARAHDLGLPFVQVGIRAVCAEERAFLRAHDLERNVFWGHAIAARPEAEWIRDVVERLEGDIYVTFDVDGLDPTIMPATGTPVPGGVGWYAALRLLRAVAARHRIIGFDVTELAPLPGLIAPDFLTARLVYKLIGYALEAELPADGTP